MILDTYLVPITEFSVSIIVPLVLTLKTLEIANRPLSTSKEVTYSTHLLKFWLSYWFLLCFIQYIGVNNHIRLCFSFFYVAQNRVISPYLIELYQVTFLPQISNIFLRVFNLRVHEDDIDSYTTKLLDQICFNGKVFDKLLSLIRLGNSSSWTLERTSVKSSLKSANNASSSSLSLSSSATAASSSYMQPRKSAQRAASGDNSQAFIQNIVPLEIQKPRARKSSVTKTANPEFSNEQKKTRKRSSDNLRSKASSTSLNGQNPQSPRCSSRSALNSRHVSNEDPEQLGQMENVPTIDDIAFTQSILNSKALNGDSFNKDYQEKQSRGLKGIFN